jgi:hypothetical protein
VVSKTLTRIESCRLKRLVRRGFQPGVKEFDRLSAGAHFLDGMGEMDLGVGWVAFFATHQNRRNGRLVLVGSKKRNPPCAY